LPETSKKPPFNQTVISHESHRIYENCPPWGFSEARRGMGFFRILVTDPPRGRPVGGHSSLKEIETLSLNLEYYYFHDVDANFLFMRVSSGAEK